MDLCDTKIKEEISLEIEDNNENYLTFDFEIGVKIESDAPVFEDWSLQSAKYQQQNTIPIDYEVVKEECDVQACLICFQVFADSSSLYEHNLTHLSVVLKQLKHLYQCDYCLIYCTSKLKIRKHIYANHYLNLKNLNGNATRISHNCNICNKTFTYKAWHGHMKNVHGTKRLSCTICSMTFKCNRYLRRHLMYIHENVRPSWRFHKQPVEEVKCNLCPAVFQNKNSFKIHMKNCHSEEAYECTLCHSKLKCKSYLLAHMRRVHYNDGILYTCDICSKVFKSSRYLTIHKKNSHGVKAMNKRAMQVMSKLV